MNVVATIARKIVQIIGADNALILLKIHATKDENYSPFKVL